MSPVNINVFNTVLVLLLIKPQNIYTDNFICKNRFLADFFPVKWENTYTHKHNKHKTCSWHCIHYSRLATIFLLGSLVLNVLHNVSNS